MVPVLGLFNGPGFGTVLSFGQVPDRDATSSPDTLTGIGQIAEIDQALQVLQDGLAVLPGFLGQQRHGRVGLPRACGGVDVVRQHHQDELGGECEMGCLRAQVTA